VGEDAPHLYDHANNITIGEFTPLRHEPEDCPMDLGRNLYDNNPRYLIRPIACTAAVHSGRLSWFSLRIAHGTMGRPEW